MLEKDDNNYSESLLSSRNSGEIINTNSNSYPLETKDSFDEQIDQEKMIVSLEELKADYTTVSAILAGDALNFREKDKFDIVKFTIKVKAVYDYTWEVYQKPADIKKNFQIFIVNYLKILWSLQEKKLIFFQLWVECQKMLFNYI